MKRIRLGIVMMALAGFVESFCAESWPGFKDTSYFPIAVWLQSPKNAERFKAAGVNTYVGLWRGPTEEQLAELKASRMKIVCDQNSVGLAHKDDPAVIVWMQDDEPDNAQSLGQGKGYGPPILPEKVIARYEEMRARDSSHPILLNLGQGVAWDQYIGRGVRRNHPEDYADYVKGGDIVSFDIYPATHDHKDIKGKLESVAHGVERLKKWAGPDRIVWNCIEAKLAENSRVSPEQLRAEVWMSLIHGSRGIIYFVHQFKPVFREASVFEDPKLLAGMTAVNKQIAELAPVLNSDSVEGAVTLKAPDDAPVASMAKRRGNDLYVFVVAMLDRGGKVAFDVKGASGEQKIDVLGEDRAITGRDGRFTDELAGYGVHLYRLTTGR